MTAVRGRTLAGTAKLAGKRTDPSRLNINVPVEAVRKLKLAKGQRLAVYVEGDRIVLEKMK